MYFHSIAQLLSVHAVEDNVTLQSQYLGYLSSVLQCRLGAGWWAWLEAFPWPVLLTHVQKLASMLLTGTVPSFCVLPKAVGLLRCISIYGAPRKLVSAIGTSRKMVVYLQTWFKEKYATCFSAQRLGPPIPGSCFWHSS